MVVPTQLEVDGLAHFVQAARELERAHLFSEDFGRIGGAGAVIAGSVHITHHNLPSAMVRDSAVLPFRRIWMNNEPCYYHKVIGLLKHYLPEHQHLIEHLEKEIKKCLKSHSDPWLKSAKRPEEIIDLWLNTRLAHCGATAKASAVGRAEFELHLRETGEAASESLFIQAIRDIGGLFIALLEFVEKVLSGAKSAGVVPSFRSDTLSKDGTHVYEDGTSVRRESPGVIRNYESESDRMVRLLMRREFSLLSDFLRLLDIPGERAIGALLVGGHLESVQKSLGLKKLAEDSKPPGAIVLRGMRRPDPKTRRICSIKVYDSQFLYLDPNAELALEEQISEIAKRP